MGLQASVAHLWRAAQRHTVVGVEGQQQLAQHQRPLGLQPALGLEYRGQIDRRFGA